MNNILIREYSCWSRHQTAAAVGAFFLFTAIAMTIGVLTVCFTTKKASMFLIFLDIKVISVEAN